MFLVGLTGGIASGKSTATSMFKALGAPVIDADQIARDVVQPGKRAWKKIREEFGEKVFLSDGQLDREALGREIFFDANKRKQLNAITHPEIRNMMVLQLFYCFLKGCQFVVVDLPLLFETKSMISFVSYVVVVSCTVDQQLQRLKTRSRLSQEEAEARIDSQMPLEEKCRRATFIVDNSGTTEMTHKQVLDLFHLFRRSTAHWPLRIFGWTSMAILSWVLLKFVQCVCWW
ncbi:dephospho-CoA kinase-like [Babylonia areolata]|uniref:dephospho-CoA kinase-like n=1 Tax=Babylonia areolata TaxID=304850 RepID=UPI003FD0C444